MIYKRQSAKKTALSSRHQCLTTKEARRERKLKRLLMLAAFACQLCDNSDEESGQIEIFEAIAVKYFTSYYALKPAKTRKIHISKRFDDFSELDCWIRFRTRKRDLPRLLRALKLDGQTFKADNGAVFTGEEILMIGLHRYCTVGSYYVTMAQVFNLDYSMLSRAFAIFNENVLANCKHLLIDNLAFWVPYLEDFAEKIRTKLSDYGVAYPPGTFRIAGFYDDTVLACARPGSGPNPDGTRKSNYIQMAFYNGWKKHHGTKYQTVEFPNGMCGDMYGPRSFKDNDLDLLSDSLLNNRFRDAQLGNNEQYALYGDGIFPIDTHTISKYTGALTANQIFENRAMSKIRVANEWDYGITGNLFPYVKYKYSMKLLKSKSTVNLYFIATILRNAHCCMYEGLTASYFDCAAPSLEDYFRV
jgi:hypothetical protein